MISEQDKQAILNGALARTNNNKKAQFMFKSDHPANVSHPYLFVISDKGKCYTDWYNDHLNSKQDKFNSSIIELWQDKPEPFDIEKALAGEPVKLRNGLKAYIKYVMPTEYKGRYPLNGYIVNTKKANDIESYTWTLEGISNLFAQPYDYDIIGMWKEPQPEPNTVTLTLPCPVLEPEIGKTYYTPIITDVDGYDLDGDFTDITEWIVEIEDDGDIDWQSQHRLEEGLVFETKNDVKAWLNAMRNNRRQPPMINKSCC